jgi:hypothetical protein
VAGQTNRWIIAILLVTAVALTGCGVGPAVESDWRNASGEPIDRGLLWSYQGPSEHCDWASAAFLAIGRTGDVAGVPADMNDQYVRDPDHLFVSELATAFQADAELPPGAVDTGYSNGTLELWLDPADSSSVYLRVDDTYERWPRVEGDDPLFCT